MKISNILEKIDEKQLFVPAFQREYVWKRDDAKMLMESLIKEYPTGTLLTWDTANPPELKGPHKYNPNQGAVKILLDGQQRATTLYMLMRGEIPPYYTLAEIMNDTRGLYVNLESLELEYYGKLKMDPNPMWQNVTDIFKGKVNAFALQKTFAAAGRELSMEELEQINENINKVTQIKEREFPEQTIPIKANIREAIDIFYKVNDGGVNLTDAELALAQISGYWPQARDLFKKKLAALKTHGFVFKLDFVVYTLLGCLHHMGSDMRRLHGEENRDRMQEAWKRLDTQVLDYVVNLLRTHAYVDHTAEINSPYALVPIIVFCFDKKGAPLTEVEIRKMVKWFYYSQVRTRYTSQLPQKLDRDLRVVNESNQPFDDLLQAISEESRLEISPSEFAGRAVQHPLFSMVRWYLKSRDAVCLTTGVGLRKPMGDKYQLELDHIFPYSQLKDAGYGWGNHVKYALAQEFTNRAILTQVANRTKSDSAAEGYLAGVKKDFPNALSLQCIPEDESLWQIDHYEDFLEARREILASKLNEFLENLTNTEGTAPVPVSVEDLIAKGESDELEFKTSLRWDIDDGALNKKLEDVVVKTVAGFGNAQGGTLLIGVEDDRNVLGIEHDYATLDGGEGDRDAYELHIRNLLNQQIGPAFVTRKVKVSFHEVEGSDLCQVAVAKSSEPIVLKVTDKNGVVHEKFYVRNGNASVEMPMSEMKAYIQDRFAK